MPSLYFPSWGLMQAGCVLPERGKKESPFYHGARGPLPSRPAPMFAVTICSMFSRCVQWQGPYAPYAQRFWPILCVGPHVLEAKDHAGTNVLYARSEALHNQVHVVYLESTGSMPWSSPTPMYSMLTSQCSQHRDPSSLS